MSLKVTAKKDIVLEPEFLILDQLNRLEKPAIEQAIKDRNRYADIYQVIEKFAKQHNMIIGGSISLKKASDESRDKDDFQYELYSEKSVHYAHDIANQIAEKTKAVIMRTDIYGKELSIIVWGRPMVRVIGIPKHYRDIMQPSVDLSQPYVPADYHLLQIYRDLYLPIPDNWNLNLENKLYKWLKKEYSVNQKRFVGGKELDFLQLRKELRSQMLDYLRSRKDIVLVGEQAKVLIQGGKTHNLHLEIIGNKCLVPEFQKWINKKTNLSVSYKTIDVNLLSDFRLARSTLYLNYEGSKVPVLYIYHSSEYDLIPFNVPSKGDFEGGQIGNPFVVLRFMMIDIWIIKVIRSHGGIDARFANEKIMKAYQQIFEFRDEMDLSLINVDEKDNLLSFFQKPDMSRYLGKFSADYYAKKRLY